MTESDSLNYSEEIIIITTGGTIEKSYSERDGTLGNKESILKSEVIDRLRLPYTHLNFYAVLDKDSLDLTDEDRNLIMLFVKSKISQGMPIIIVHGTDTMEVTAKFCYDNLIGGDIRVPILFTGAMRPIGFTNSDAKQNITEAIYAAKLISPGIYISFHNRLYEVPHVRKNRKAGTFEAI